MVRTIASSPVILAIVELVNHFVVVSLAQQGISATTVAAHSFLASFTLCIREDNLYSTSPHAMDHIIDDVTSCFSDVLCIWDWG